MRKERKKKKLSYSSRLEGENERKASVDAPDIMIRKQDIASD